MWFPREQPYALGFSGREGRRVVHHGVVEADVGDFEMRMDALAAAMVSGDDGVLYDYSVLILYGLVHVSLCWIYHALV